MSKKAFGSAAIVGLALMDAGSAMAGPPPAPYDWTGFYIGAEGGGAWQKINYSNGVVGSVSPGSFIAGGYGGYNYQFSNGFVVGAEGRLDFTNLNETFGSLNTRTNWMASVGGRIGYSVNGFLPYVGVSGVVSELTQTFTGGVPVSVGRTGWMFNAGVEVRLGNFLNPGADYSALRNWSVRAEYRRANFGKADTFGDLRTKLVSDVFVFGFSTKIDKYTLRA